MFAALLSSVLKILSGSSVLFIIAFKMLTLIFLYCHPLSGACLFNISVQIWQKFKKSIFIRRNRLDIQFNFKRIYKSLVWKFLVISVNWYPLNAVTVSLWKPYNEVSFTHEFWNVLFVLFFFINRRSIHLGYSGFL